MPPASKNTSADASTQIVAVVAGSRCWQRVLFGALGAVLFPLLAHAQDSMQWKTNYYPVAGTTVREIRQSLNASRPWKATATTDAETKWQITWRFNVASSGGKCRSTSFRTMTKVTLTLPLWAAPTNAAPAVRKSWERYIAALTGHEIGHVQFAKAAAAEMHKQVKALGEHSDCQSLDNAINEKARAILEDYRNREKEFDTRTRHGAIQGAHFP